MRRDLTINALFYNLDTRSVEDFSGRGLDDLRAGVICTPLAPRETFMDGEALAALCGMVTKSGGGCNGMPAAAGAVQCTIWGSTLQ